MSQNLVSVVVTQDQQGLALASVKQLKDALPGLISLSAEIKKGLNYMGAKSDPFARVMIRLMANNPGGVPSNIDVKGAQEDLAAMDMLRPVLEAVEQVRVMLQDTYDALGSDVMDVALDGYAILKVSGDAEGLKELTKEVGTRFSRRRVRPIESAK